MARARVAAPAPADFGHACQRQPLCALGTLRRSFGLKSVQRAHRGLSHGQNGVACGITAIGSPCHRRMRLANRCMSLPALCDAGLQRARVVRNQNGPGRACIPARDVSGAPGRIRTVDTRFRRAVLYPLSYGGMRESLAQDRSLANFGRCELRIVRPKRTDPTSSGTPCPRQGCRSSLAVQA